MTVSADGEHPDLAGGVDNRGQRARDEDRGVR
jgi:hypothetical protein